MLTNKQWRLGLFVVALVITARTHARACGRACGTARHGAARRGAAQHGAARHGTARHGTARHGTVPYGYVVPSTTGRHMCHPYMHISHSHMSGTWMLS